MWAATLAPDTWTVIYSACVPPHDVPPGATQAGPCAHARSLQPARAGAEVRFTAPRRRRADLTSKGGTVRDLRLTARPTSPARRSPRSPKIPGCWFRVPQPREVQQLASGLALLVSNSWFQILDARPLQLGFVVSFI